MPIRGADSSVSRPSYFERMRSSPSTDSATEFSCTRASWAATPSRLSPSRVSRIVDLMSDVEESLSRPRLS